MAQTPQYPGTATLSSRQIKQTMLAVVYKKFKQTFKIYLVFLKNVNWKSEVQRWQDFIFNISALHLYPHTARDSCGQVCVNFVLHRWLTIIPQASNNLSLGRAPLEQPTTTLLKTEMEGRKNSHISFAQTLHCKENIMPSMQNLNPASVHNS